MTRFSTKSINEKREARAEQLEKIAHIKEIVHTTIAGVCVAVGTVTLIAGEIATGGAATAILAAGAVASIVGGVNAVVKCCTEFEKNAVIISQCVNAETVRSGGRHSSIAGRLCDGCMIYDCLTTIGTNGEFAGDIGKSLRGESQYISCSSRRVQARRCIEQMCLRRLLSRQRGHKME